jgi:hypothetical protein
MTMTVVMRFDIERRRDSTFGHLLWSDTKEAPKRTRGNEVHMTNAPTHKTWVSPITAVSFVAVTLTGILMLFHVRLPGIRGIHEWMGIVMALGGIFHLILNWKTFLCHFRRRRAVAALLGTVALIAAALLVPGEENHRRGGREGRGRPGPGEPTTGEAREH